MIDAVLLAATAAIAPFRPPLGVPLTYVSREDRVIGGRTLHFESHRQITFTRNDDGFVATIRFDHAANDAGGDVAAMFQAAMASLADRAVTLHLDAAGKVVAVDDAAGAWSALCDAVARLPGTGSQREHAATFAAALRMLPGDQRKAMLGSLVAPLIAGADASLTPGSTKPVEIRARPPLPSDTKIKGSQTVTRGAKGRLLLHVTAAGDAPMANGAAAHVDSDRERVIDPATGLVLATHDHLATTIGNDRTTTESSATLTSPVL